MTGRITDYHQFEIWRHEDNAVDIHCSRQDCEVDPETAILEAEVVARTLSEKVQDANELFRIKLYDNGVSSTMVRDSVAGDKWGRFRWVRERTHAAVYSGVIALPKPPEWFMAALWGAEFAASLGMLTWGRLRGKWIQSGKLAELREESEQLEMQDEEYSSGSTNVVAFPGKRPV